MLPNFLHVGAAKAASTWLLSAWLEHPSIYAPPGVSNIDFFHSTYYKGLEWYERRYFSGWSGERAVGHKGNAYMVSDLALERIKRDLPGVKLQMILRNPIERTFLQWAHTKTWHTAPLEQPLSGTGGWVKFRMWYEQGLYAQHLKRVFRLFPEERVRVMFYDDLVEDPESIMRGQFEWLGVDADFKPTTLHQLVGFPSPERPDTADGDIEKGMPEDTHEELRLLFREDIDELQEMTGRDLGHWR